MTGGGTAVLAAVCAGTAAALWVGPRPRLARLGLRRREQPPEPGEPPAVRFRLTVVVLTATVLAVLVGGGSGWVVGVLAGVGLERWTARAEPRADRDRARRREAALPGAVDLLVACLRAGASQVSAVAAVITAVPPDLADDLRGVVVRIERGATPAEAWSASSTDLQGVARVLRRSGETGAPAADLLAGLADELRARRRARWLDDARGLGVRATGPLGLCFLPGFTLLGVIPVVVGLATSLW